MRDSVRMNLAEADGRVLREPVMSPQDQPAFDRSAVDGFVVSPPTNPGRSVWWMKSKPGNGSSANSAKARP